MDRWSNLYPRHAVLRRAEGEEVVLRELRQRGVEQGRPTLRRMWCKPDQVEVPTGQTPSN